jgi:hypothetical protein
MLKFRNYKEESKIAALNNSIALRNSINVNNYIDYKQKQKQKNDYNPDVNNIKYLTVIACHCNTETKLNTIKNNLQFFNFNTNDIIIINSSNLQFNDQLKHICNENNNITYYEINNNSTLDFGKWNYILSIIDYNKYNHIVFTNDSFIIHNTINYFFNLIYKYNTQLYGYNDSTQICYHYQSYFFSIRKDSIQIFIDKFEESKNLIQTYNDVVNFYEIKMIDWFNLKKCFLKIGNNQYNKGQNIFFTNDKLYDILKNSSLLPFTKLKELFKINNINNYLYYIINVG